ncbi:MAG: DUF3326 domain-containing protein [Gaiellaceae bacterium]|jgi:hypothetical protein
MSDLCAYEAELDLPRPKAPPHVDPIVESLGMQVPTGTVPIRMAVVRSSPHSLEVEVGVLEGLDKADRARLAAMLRLRRRAVERSETFTTVMLVPTGIGCAIGGHAGDASAAVRLLAAVTDRLITHPNAVNASDLNDLPENALYVEGSVLTRFLLGTAGLVPVRANRVLAVADRDVDERFAEIAVNSAAAVRVTGGVNCTQVLLLEPHVTLASAYAPSGRATGRVEHLERLLSVLEERRDSFDAVAISTRIEVPWSYHRDYYEQRGEMVNPWGGVEALLTHAVSSLLDVPTAHSPMFESRDAAAVEVGIVDPRMAAEVISLGFFVSVVEGLARAPRIVPLAGPPDAGVLAVEDVSCLVIPDKVVGLPTLAALDQGIPVVAVRENANVMANDLTSLPWRPGQLRMVENYWEAAGVVAALRAGVDPATVRRPLADLAVARPSALRVLIP